MNTISQKIKQVFSEIAIMKDANRESIFTGRNLPSFVKDFLLRRYTNAKGVVDKQAITDFLNKFIPDKDYPAINRLLNGETVQLLTRFIVQSDIQGGKVRFAIPEAGIKASEAIIPDRLIGEYQEELVDGEHWGVIKLAYIRPSGKIKGYVEMADFKPFRPYSVDLEYFKECRKKFTIEEWIDVLLSAMEYSPAGFDDIEQKLEFLTRLLPFVEPRLNMIELAPKGTGKSYIFNNLSKYGWLVSGGKVSRAKLFYNKSTQKPGIMKNNDVVAFDEIKTISFSDDLEMQSFLQNYLEEGKATIDNYTFESECGLTLLGNIELTKHKKPLNPNYFQELPDIFHVSALWDRLHGFIEGWKLPRIHTDMIMNGWTLNVEYFSEILHLLRVENDYSLLVNNLLQCEEKADVRHLKAVKRMATAYSKLLFPHITKIDDLDEDEFETYCLIPAILRRVIILDQCIRMDAEYKENKMPKIGIKGRDFIELDNDCNFENEDNDSTENFGDIEDDVEDENPLENIEELVQNILGNLPKEMAKDVQTMALIISKLNEANYRYISPIQVNNDFLPVLAAAKDEVFVLADVVNYSIEFNAKIDKLNTIYGKVKELIDETLEDIEIHYFKLLIAPSNIYVDEEIIAKLSESDIQLVCLDENADNYLPNCLPQRNESTKDEQDDFIAYIEYIDTIVEYFAEKTDDDDDPTPDNIQIDDSVTKSKPTVQNIQQVDSIHKTKESVQLEKVISDKRPKGFAAIAGMQDLKNLLQTEVIDVIKNPEEYRQHGLGLPNGMLLYGPPGCGKTFFAQHFAEEAGFNCQKLIVSDLVSRWVGETEKTIKTAFEDAKKNAPTILIFDEIDTLMPDRDNDLKHWDKSMVNEFLSQLDNIGDSGVFIIGSTNNPHLIDKAILRAGRLEKHIYLSPPDFEARKAMFELYLKNKPIDGDIDYDKLAALTENYVSGDIKLICDDASRKVIREKTHRVSMEILEYIVANLKPSISVSDIKKYESINAKMEGKENERPKIGFNA
jgi:ATP-dependent Lon protease